MGGDIIYKCGVCLDTRRIGVHSCPYCKTRKHDQILVEQKEKEWKIDTIKRMKYQLDLESETIQELRATCNYCSTMSGYLSDRSVMISEIHANLNMKLEELQK